AAHTNLGNVFMAGGDLTNAEKCYQNALKIDPDHINALNNLGNARKKAGKPEAAESAYQKAIALKPDLAEAHSNLGVIFQENGQLEKAVASFKKAISINPALAETHKYLSFAVRHTEYDQDIKAMERLYNQKTITPQQRMFLGFALGKAFEDLKEYDKAFEYIAQANRLMRSTIHFSIEETQTLFDRITKTFTKDFFDACNEFGHPDPTPIFIIGMPRSGTTLVEQILASHSRVFGAGERNAFMSLTQNILSRLFSTSHHPDTIKTFKTISQQIGQEYISTIRQQSHDAKHITDKMPYNFLLVGLIKTCLPNAKIIHCKRNPMATCFSIFKNHFPDTKANLYAYDLNELGQYYNLYQSLMSHWKKVLPNYIHEINYEDLVSAQEKHTRQMLNFCNLPWDKQCLSFHKSKRKVATASAFQVRQPIYEDSVQFWKRYEIELKCLQKIIYGDSGSD
ncbi:MAG: tetratricopeptide repeat protein, partial [Desulfobacteraceae bacterium]|nr:tetratricopeptide repeat protein [Desulfobacteraceae bacterium]